jgi:hypothetical protein
MLRWLLEAQSEGNKSYSDIRSDPTTNFTPFDLKMLAQSTNVMLSGITHNNRGVAFLEKGFHDHALAEFKSAAQLLYAFTQELKKDLKDATSPSPPGSSFTECRPSERPIASTSAFICSTPIIMLGSDQASSSCTIESASILLNMALTYHVNSLQANPMHNGIKNAMELYEMAYGLAIQVHGDSRSHKIIVTSLNNVGLIKYEMGEFGAADRCLKDLTTYINFVKNDVSQGVEMFDAGELYECMLNAMILRNAHHCAGAA